MSEKGRASSVRGNKDSCSVLVLGILLPETPVLTQQRAPTSNLINPSTRCRWTPQSPPGQLLTNGQHSMVSQSCREEKKLLLRTKLSPMQQTFPPSFSQKKLICRGKWFSLENRCLARTGPDPDSPLLGSPCTALIFWFLLGLSGPGSAWG